MPRISSAELIDTAFLPKQIPETNLPEIAFAGRSNVGKSSILNALMGTKKLVRVSSRPGFTQSINFYLVNNKVTFVDLPGYGYVKAPVRLMEKWRILVESYLQKKKNLKGVVCIFDIRRTPDHLDASLIEYMKTSLISYLMVLNKADKLSQPKRAGQIKIISERLSIERDRFIITSARTGEGIEELLEGIFMLSLGEN
jgi:GTP-binding protein